MATKTTERPSARERLLAAADELFYRDGVHSTGIDAVIEKAGVAKGSLYYIFGGKDELVAAYLRGRHERFRQQVEEAQAGIDDPADKILALFDALADYISLPEYRGCPFDSAAAEAPTGECQVLAINEYRDWLHQAYSNSPKTPECPTPGRWPRRSSSCTTGRWRPRTQDRHRAPPR